MRYAPRAEGSSRNFRFTMALKESGRLEEDHGAVPVGTAQTAFLNIRVASVSRET